MIKLKEKFHFNPPVEVKDDWMIGFLSLEVHNSICKTTEEKNKFELYTDEFKGGFSFSALKDKVAEVLGRSDNSVEDSELEIHGSDNIKTYRKLSTEKCQTDGYYILIIKYMHTSSREFQSCLRTYNPLNENDIQFILKR